MIRRVQPDSPGVEPNWADWEAVGYLVCLGLITFFFGLRCYAKLKLSQPLHAEDWCCSISWLLSALEIAISCKMVQYGLTQPAWLLSPEQTEHLHKWLYAVSIVYGPAVLATKLTLLVIMARLFSIHNIVALGIRLFIVTMLFFYLVLTIMKAFVCQPVRAFWDAEILKHGGRCMNQTTIFIADTSFAVLTDSTILVLPIFLAISLRISFFRKLKVIVMLGAGGAAVGVTVYRAILVVEYEHTTNYTKDFANILFYCLVEVAIGQICACLPFTNLLLKKKSNDSKRKRSTTKRSHPSADVFGSSQGPGQRLKSFDSVFAHLNLHKTSSTGCREPRLSPKAWYSSIVPSSHSWAASSSPPLHSQNRAPSTGWTGSQPPFLSRAIKTRMTAMDEEAHEAARRPASLPPVDDWYWRDLEGCWRPLGDAEPPLSPPPQPCVTSMLRTPSEILVPNRIVS